MSSNFIVLSIPAPALPVNAPLSYPISRQATVASVSVNESSHTVPHELPPASLTLNNPDAVPVEPPLESPPSADPDPPLPDPLSPADPELPVKPPDSPHQSDPTPAITFSPC